MLFIARKIDIWLAKKQERKNKNVVDHSNNNWSSAYGGNYHSCHYAKKEKN